MQRPERERKEPTEFNVIVKAKDLVKHTFTITNSTERYPKKYRFTLVNRIQDKAVDIYECVLEANELDLRDAQEYRQRQKLQAKALTYCKELLFFILDRKRRGDPQGAPPEQEQYEAEVEEISRPSRGGTDRRKDR